MLVTCFITQWMKRSKHGLFVFPPKNPSCGEGVVRLANRVVLLRQSEVSVDLWKVLGHEVFSRKRSLNQPKATLFCTSSINQWNRSIVVRLLLLFCSRVFTSRSCENRSIYVHIAYDFQLELWYILFSKKPFTYRKGFFNSVKHCCSFLLKQKELTGWQMIRNGIHVVCLHFVVKCSDVEGLGCVW